MNLLPRQRLAWLSGGDTRERERELVEFEIVFFCHHFSPLLSFRLWERVVRVAERPRRDLLKLLELFCRAKPRQNTGEDSFLIRVSSIPWHAPMLRNVFFA